MSTARNTLLPLMAASISKLAMAACPSNPSQSMSRAKARASNLPVPGYEESLLLQPMKTCDGQIVDFDKQHSYHSTEILDYFHAARTIDDFAPWRPAADRGNFPRRATMEPSAPPRPLSPTPEVLERLREAEREARDGLARGDHSLGGRELLSEADDGHGVRAGRLRDPLLPRRSSSRERTSSISTPATSSRRRSSCATRSPAAMESKSS